VRHILGANEAFPCFRPSVTKFAMAGVATKATLSYVGGYRSLMWVALRPVTATVRECGAFLTLPGFSITAMMQCTTLNRPQSSSPIV